MNDAFPEAKPVAVVAAKAPARTKPSNYPEPFASRMAGREKRPLGDLFGLANFGVNRDRRGAVFAIHDDDRIMVRLCIRLDRPIHARGEFVLKGSTPAPDRCLI